MTTKETGGPAYPFSGFEFFDTRRNNGEGERVVYEPHKGMTLRDYFAAKALTMVSAGNEHTDMVGWDYRHFAEYAYRMADAMLAERTK